MTDPVLSRRRWVVLALLFFSTLLNYVDRQTLSILSTQVQHDLAMTALDYARVVQFFLIAYTCAYLISGWLTDKLGTKLSLAIFVTWWSLANMLTGLVQNFGQLSAARAALGLGEAGNYTAAPKAVSENFPIQERALAVGIYTAGAMIGATIAPPLIAFLAITYSWRAAFILTGVAGLIWVVAWLAIYKQSVPQLEVIAEPKLKLQAILRDKSIWLLMTARLLADPVWYFYLFWFPKYMTEGRGMSLIEVAQLAWIVYLAADIGSIVGGLLSGWLIKRGIAAQKSRLMVMTISAIIAPAGMLIALGVATIPMLVLGSLVTFSHLMFQINHGALIVDRYPKGSIATVFGIMGAGSGIGGALSTQMVGQLVGGGSYELVFVLMGCLHPLACALCWLAIRRSAPLANLSQSESRL